ncbi:MAG: ATP-binding protein [Desulfobacteraceae bacterium]|jgi:nitrogen fixation/metabolism regulation signal transduction histidine kinase
MAFKHFGLFIMFRLAALSLGIAGFVYAFNNPRYHVVTFLIFVIVIGLIYELWFFLSRTNREVARFLASAKYTDFNQSFEFEDTGAGFKSLGESLTLILENFRKTRITQEAELSHMRAVVNHIPVPLMTVKQDGSLVLLNNAARRFFGTPQPTKLSDIKQYGEDFYEQLLICKAGERPVVKISIDGLDTQLSLGLMEVTGNKGTEKLFSLQDIGEELESTQLNAWQDLVRVLTHEIMNSITPVASLAQTTADIAGDVIQELPESNPQKGEIEKISTAAMTMSRRAGNLMQFVTNFRQLTRLPKPDKKATRVQDLLNHVTQIAKANNPDSNVKLVTEVTPSGLELSIDPEQIEQALINLLRNAEQALADQQDGEIRLVSCLNQRGRVTIEVTDNGPGIKEDILNKIFVPYFTTKPEGSGIGLALTRQIMAYHGGFIRASNLENSGARFKLTF